jgi:AcrR family transcriptional regulator
MTQRSTPSDTDRMRARKTPSQTRSAQTVASILEGAALVLEQKGIADYTTNKIARRAGVSIGSLYQYFPTKDAVTMSLLERERAILAAEVVDALAIEDPGQALRSMIQAAVRDQLRRPALARLLDLEEERLSPLMPPSGSAALARRSITDFFCRQFDLESDAAEIVSSDIIAIMRALTDAAGRREQVDAVQLERVIQGSVTGYLDAL